MNNNLCKGHISKYSDILFFFFPMLHFFTTFWGSGGLGLQQMNLRRHRLGHNSLFWSVTIVANTGIPGTACLDTVY